MYVWLVRQSFEYTGDWLLGVALTWEQGQAMYERALAREDRVGTVQLVRVLVGTLEPSPSILETLEVEA
jgi:hypothetical protein